MTALDRIRRIHIVRTLSVLFVALVIAYIIPDILGMVAKDGDPDITKWQAAMASNPIRMVHRLGLTIASISAIYVFVLWSKRFTEPRAGE